MSPIQESDTIRPLAMMMLSLIARATAVLGTSAYAVTAQAGPTSRFLGRVDPSTRELTWPATGIAVAFEGTSASISITSKTGDPAVEMVVDGGAPIVMHRVTGSSIDTPPGLPRGRHTVEIRKRSEAYFGSLFLGEPTTDGTLLPVRAPKRRIELIGDSITVGYGLEGVFPCANAAHLEAATRTYGALTARNLSADYSIVAWSGKGVTRNYVTPEPDPSPLMPELWAQYGALSPRPYDFATPVDAVVINLGTNDFSFRTGVRPQLDMAVFTAALTRFARAVHARYPSAAMFITSSPLLGNDTPEQQRTKHVAAVKATIASLDFTAYFVDFPTQDASNNNIGCDYHPSARTNEEMSVILTAAIQKVMGWGACRSRSL
ncbi:hypothetical protein RB597_004013 [Gaeumannomyces tritici]